MIRVGGGIEWRSRLAAALAIVVLASAFVVLGTEPADAQTVSCGSLTHTGSYSTDEAWAYWNWVNDNDCEVAIAAKCNTDPGMGWGWWYWGPYVPLGSTSREDCDWHGSRDEIQTWGYGWHG